MRSKDGRYLLGAALGLVLGMTWLLCLGLLAWPLDRNPAFGVIAAVFTALWVVGSGLVSWWVLRRFAVRRPGLTAGASIVLVLVVSAFGYVWLPTMFAPLVFALCFLVAALVVDLLPAHVKGPLRGRRPQGPVQ